MKVCVCCLVLVIGGAAACDSTDSLPGSASSSAIAATTGAATAVASAGATAAEATAEPARDDEALVDAHNEIWALLGVSEKAQAELNKVVVDIKGKLAHNAATNPELMAKYAEAKRAKTVSYDDFVGNHSKRFKMLGITDATQKELFAAMEVVWKALHDPSVPEAERKRAETIREMMKEGPPPCCDDNIFMRASAP